MKRETRLINKEVLDDPDEPLEAGSESEADIISDWDRSELVETIQKLDQQLFEAEKEIKKLKRMVQQ